MKEESQQLYSVNPMVRTSLIWFLSSLHLWDDGWALHRVDRRGYIKAHQNVPKTQSFYSHVYLLVEKKNVTTSKSDGAGFINGTTDVRVLISLKVHIWISHSKGMAVRFQRNRKFVS